MSRSHNILAPRKPWTDDDLRLLQERFPNTQTRLVAEALGRTESTVNSKAYSLGLSKTVEYLSSPAAGRLDGIRGSACRFVPGQKSWTKGTKGVVGVQDGCRATQFKPGRAASEAHNYLPIGSERINADGHLERKWTDDASVRPARRWAPVYRLVWESAHGPIPDRHVVTFLPGRASTDPEAITVDALELVSRMDWMRRNTIHRFGPEISTLMRLRGAITRQINKRTKESGS